MFGAVVGYGMASRRIGVLIAVVIGALVVAVVAASTAVAPLAVYPFI